MFELQNCFLGSEKVPSVSSGSYGFSAGLRPAGKPQELFWIFREAAFGRHQTSGPQELKTAGTFLKRQKPQELVPAVPTVPQEYVTPWYASSAGDCVTF